MSERATLDAIAEERTAQLNKFRDRESNGLSRLKLLAILTEEFLEVARAVNDHADWLELRTELVQVAAVCVKFVSLRDRAERTLALEAADRGEREGE